MRLLLPLLTVLVACSYETRNGLDRVQCAETVSVLGIADETPLGTSAEAVLAEIGGPVTTPLTWSRLATTTNLTLEARWDGGEVRFVDQEPVEAGTEEGCGQWLEVDVTLDVATDDGSFAESWPLTLQVVQAGSASWQQDLDAVSLVGTFDPVDHGDPTADYDSLGSEIGGTLDADGGAGEVTLQGEGTGDCDGGECQGWSSRESVGTWGVAEE
ncbi:MAG: hypothetical protein Q8P41_14565 [Pseudomonadota bacterium]|nr:hypothetical protein [Pseudomonadota bacterium]